MKIIKGKQKSTQGSPLLHKNIILDRKREQFYRQAKGKNLALLNQPYKNVKETSEKKVKYINQKYVYYERKNLTDKGNHTIEKVDLTRMKASWKSKDKLSKLSRSTMSI